MDVDECEAIAKKYKVESMPTTIFFRNNMPIQGSKIIGGGPQWLHGISKGLAELSNEAERVGIAQFLHEEAGVSSSTKHVAEIMAVTNNDLFSLATTP